MRKPQLAASSTLEFFTFKGDTIKDVKVKIASDIPSSYPRDIKEHMLNVQFGMFYMFLTDEEQIAKVGSIFRAGMIFANNSNGGPPNDRDFDDEPDPDPEDELMMPIKELEEKYLKDKDVDG